MTEIIPLQSEQQNELSSVSRVTDAKEDGEWTTPIRVGCSLDKNKRDLEYGQVSILSNSRFSVLSEEKEGDIELGKA